MIALNGTYFLSASAYGNITQHGGPKSPYNQASAAPDSHYSSYMGRASRFHGPYTNGQGQPGSWLAVDNGGHNNFFFTDINGTDDRLFATVWYGSEPHNNTPPGAGELVDLPSVIEVQAKGGELVAISTRRS